MTSTTLICMAILILNSMMVWISCRINKLDKRIAVLEDMAVKKAIKNLNDSIQRYVNETPLTFGSEEDTES